MRQVKIVATMGPATRDRERLVALFNAGVDVVRLNFSHGTREEHEATFRDVRSVAAQLGRPVAVLQDLGGPKIRVGDLENDTPVPLIDGQDITITTRPVAGNAHVVSTNYEHLPQDIRPGDPILLADGNIVLRTISSTADEIRAVVVHGGLLAAHQGINLPGVPISTPALTPKDRDDLAFGLRLGVDFVALSFVRSQDDVLRVKELIHAQQATTPVIAKLEKREAIDRLDEIIAVADGIMVARGDLGVELPLEDVPVLQKLIIRKANARGIPVITATQMLDSMVNQPRPTRAEVSDVANAILDGTDAVMLSAETAVGRFPVEAVEMMNRIAQATSTVPLIRTPQHKAASYSEALCRAAASTAQDVAAKAIVVFTRSGHTANLMCKERPLVPIVALVADEQVYRRLSLWWGVTPIICDLSANTDATIAHAEHLLLQRGFVAEGDHVIVVASSPSFREARTNFVSLHRIG